MIVLGPPGVAPSKGAGGGAGPGVGAGFGLGKGTDAMLAYLTSLFNSEEKQPGLAPLTPAQIAQQAGSYVTNAIKPQLGSMANETAAATAGGVGQIRGGTANYASALEPIAGNVQAIGDKQADETTAETSALSDYLKGAGAATFGDVQNQLTAAGIGEPAAPNLGAGAAGITSAVGLASARDASDEGANNATLAALLPGFANLTGQQAEDQFRATQQGNLNSQEQTLEAQIPGLTSQIVQQLSQNETTKAGDRASALNDRNSAIGTFLGNAVDDNTQLQLGNLTLTGNEAKAAAPVFRTANGGIYEVDPTTGQAVTVLAPSPKTSPTAKAQSSAVAKANSTALSIIKSAAKGAKVTQTDPLTGAKTSKVEKSPVGSAAYYQAIHEAEAAIEPIVGSYMTPDEITRFVQRQANTYFAPAPKDTSYVGLQPGK